MTTEQIRNKFLNNPSYLKKGAGYLSRFWKVPSSVITEIRNEIRNERKAVKTHTTSSVYTNNTPSIDTPSPIITIQSDKALSPKEIAVFAQVDGITNYVSNYWLKSHKNGTYTYSIQVRTQKEDIFASVLKSIEDLKFTFPKYPKVQSTDSFLVMSLSDLHFDKKSYIEEKDNVLEKAQQAANYLLDISSKTSKFSDIYLILGNDFFNHDTYYNQTTKGTPQDSEGDYGNSFYDALTFCTQIINNFVTKGYKVHVFSPKGNHDASKSQFLQAALKKIYETASTVTINFSTKDRQYFTVGEVSFMVTHGDNIKYQKLPTIFAVENPYSWTNKFKVVLTGHTHRKGEISFISTDEDLGIDIKICPSLSKTDKWHYENGYIGNKRRAVAFLYSKDLGELATFNSISI